MKKNRAGFKVGLWLLRAFQVKIAQVCMSEVVYTFIRGAKGQEKLRITCILLNYLRHHFHTTKFHVVFF